MSLLIDLSHAVEDGLITYPGLPGPSVSTFMSFDDSHDRYASGTEFEIHRIAMIGNTGTYLDTPAHRHRSSWDLTGLPLELVAAVPGVVVRCRGHRQRALDPGGLEGVDVANAAVLFDTGWSRHWGTAEYGSGHPYLAAETVERLVAAGPRLVGIDSLNIDGTDDGTRPAHTRLLGSGIPIVEHLADLSLLPDAGFTFFAVPPRVRGMGSFPVRAFAMIDG